MMRSTGRGECDKGDEKKEGKDGEEEEEEVRDHVAPPTVLKSQLPNSTSCELP